MIKLKQLFYLCFLLIITYTSSAEAVIDNNGAAFLLNPVGARAISLGHSYRAVGKDGFALMWNPAGLAHTKSSQINLYHTTLLSALTHQYIGYSHRFLDAWSMGVSYSSFAVDDIIEANSSGIRSGNTFGFRGNTLTIGSGLKLGLFLKELNDVSIGLSSKFIGQQLHHHSAQGMTVDGGLLMRFSNVNLALTAHNFVQLPMVWTTENKTTEYMLRYVGLGISYYVWPRFFVQSEVSIANDGAYTYALSSEWTLLSSPFAQLDLRGGIHQKRGFKLGKIAMTAGVGLTLWNLSVDYAYDVAPLEFLDNNHIFSINYDI